MSSSEQKLKEKLKDLIKYPSMEDVAKALDKLGSAKSFQKEKVISKVLKDLGFYIDLFVHPIVSKTIELGNLGKDLKKDPNYEKLSEKIFEIMKRRKPTIKDYNDITELVRKLIDKMITYIVQRAGESEKGLRHIHAPGSVTKGEARNLYFGERYNADILLNMALRQCSSLFVGNDIGISFEDEEFYRDLTRMLERKYGSTIELPAHELGISKYEYRRPYTVLVKFFLWLYQKYDEENFEEKEFLRILLDRLKNTSITLYFTPGKEKDKWCLISIPRIDQFASRWLEDKEQRTKLEELDLKLNIFISELIKKAGRQREIENIVELIMHNYELLSQQLLLFGTVEYASLRNIINLVTELAIRYDVQATMDYCKWLT